MKQHGWMILALALALALPAVAQKSNGKQAPAKAMGEPAGAAKAEAPAAATEDPSYVIGADDMLTVNVWKEADMSGQVPVRPDGKISMPLINDVQAAGLTPMELAKSISEKLKMYLEQPQVTVIVTQINSRRVYLVGQVHAGAFPLLPNMTVLQALSAAGCCSEFANTKKIYVLRNENGKQVKYPFNYKEALKGGSEKENILLQPGDTIVVP